MLIKSQNNPALYLPTPSPEPSPYRSALILDEDLIMADDHNPTNAPTGSHEPLTAPPSLQDILDGSVRHPWTLSSFAQNLSNLHCLENLEFMLDSNRYREKYEIATATPLPDGFNEAEALKELRDLWQRLIEAYIRPNSSREVNLTGKIRDDLLHAPVNDVPPSPTLLNKALEMVRTLLGDTIMIIFQQEQAAARAKEMEDTDSLDERTTRGSGDAYSQPGRSSRGQSPKADILNRQGRSDSLQKHHAVARNRLTLSNSTTSTVSGETFPSDENSSINSPSNSPMTPPTTPPSSDLSGTSPRSRHDTWRKVMRFGKPKKPSRPGQEE